ncbi:MAG: GTP-binding protein [Porticoccaceae bacterium]|nr:GTP-binding protein [Porticoccaceae bacterium]
MVPIAVIPITVITGFLGSGKTTLISRLLQSPDLADTAVIVNEFGETDLDHSLIAASSENILQLMNGCICCTIREDLALELRNLFHLRALGDVPRFNRVVIETTGLADPVPIIHTLMANTELRKVYRMQAVITVVDGIVGARTLADQQVSTRQVALADQLLISKTDIADVDADTTELENLRAMLGEINPSAVIVDIQNQSDSALLSLLLSENSYPLKGGVANLEHWLGDTSASRHDHGHGSGIQTFTLYREPAISLADLILFFHELVNYHPDKLLRVKGLVLIKDKTDTPVVVHAIREKVYPLVWLEGWPSAKRETQLVFITDGIAREEIEQMLNTVCNAE